MTTLQRLGAVERNLQQQQSALEFAHVCRWLGKAKGNELKAAELARQHRALPHIVEALLESKAAVTPGTLTGWAQPLAAYSLLADGFLASLRQYSAFDAMLPFMRRFAIELQTLIVATSGSTGSTVEEFAPKPVSRPQYQTITPTLLKTIAQVVYSAQVFDYATNVPSIQQDLSAAVAQAIDSSFVTRLISSITPVPSNGVSYAAVVLDLATLLAALSLNARSKVFLLVDSPICKYWSIVGTTQPAFATMMPTGGTLQGMTVIPTAGVSQMIVACDASQIFAASGVLEMDASKEASIELDSAPTSPPTAGTIQTSLWQMNAVSLKATRFWAAERGRSGAVAVISGVSYGSGSP
jgi:hypothetical protein